MYTGGSEVWRFGPTCLRLPPQSTLFGVTHSSCFGCLCVQVYAAPLAGGDRVVVLMNTHTTGGQYLTSNLTVTWRQLGLPHDSSAKVRDLYAEADLGEATGSVTAAVQAHDVRVLRISPLGGQHSDDWRPWHQQPAGARQSSAGSGRKIAPGGDQHAMYAF